MTSPLLLVLLAVGCSLAASATAATDSLVVVPVLSLYGGAAWAINTRIGTPPIDYGLYMDTGSSDLIVSKTNCVGCSPYGRRYNPTASSSAKGTPCNGEAARRHPLSIVRVSLTRTVVAAVWQTGTSSCPCGVHRLHQCHVHGQRAVCRPTC